MRFVLAKRRVLSNLIKTSYLRCHVAHCCTGGIAVTLVGHPFDTVKVRLQTQDFAKPIYCKTGPLQFAFVFFESLTSSALCSWGPRLCQEDCAVGRAAWFVQGTSCSNCHAEHRVIDASSGCLHILPLPFHIQPDSSHLAVTLFDRYVLQTTAQQWPPLRCHTVGPTLCRCCAQGVTSPLAGQMLFRSIMFGAFGQTKTWFATNKDGSVRAPRYSDFYKVLPALYCTAD